MSQTNYGKFYTHLIKDKLRNQMKNEQVVNYTLPIFLFFFCPFFANFNNEGNIK